MRVVVVKEGEGTLAGFLSGPGWAQSPGWCGRTTPGEEPTRRDFVSHVHFRLLYAMPLLGSKGDKRKTLVVAGGRVELSGCRKGHWMLFSSLDADLSG